METDEPCDVEVLDHRARTFGVRGPPLRACLRRRARARTTVRGLARRGDPVAPPGPRVPSQHHPHGRSGGRGSLIFGSCRVALPHHPPFTLPKEEDERGRGLDALHALALSMLESQPDRWPELVLLLGDQVYADEVSPQALEFIRSRRDTTRPR